MYIRDGNLQDLPSMIALLEQLFSIEEDFIFDAKKHQTALNHIIKEPNCGCKVAENTQGEVIGMCTAQWVYSTATGNKSAWMEDLVVAQAQRQQQVGQQLLQHITQWAQQQGCGRIQLVYDLNNTPAINFYQKHRFNQTQLGVFSKPLDIKSLK